MELEKVSRRVHWVVGPFPPGAIPEVMELSEPLGWEHVTTMYAFAVQASQKLIAPVQSAPQVVPLYLLHFAIRVINGMTPKYPDLRKYGIAQESTE